MRTHKKKFLEVFRIVFVGYNVQRAMSHVSARPWSLLPWPGHAGMTRPHNWVKGRITLHSHGEANGSPSKYAILN